MFRRRSRDERGAVALEAALIVPVLMFFIFGIVELATLVRDDVAVTSAARAGGRMASAQAGAGTVDVVTNKACTTTTSQCAPQLAQLAADAVQKAGNTMPNDSITRLIVYKANNKGFPGADGATAMTCSTNCVSYTWNTSQDAFRYNGGSWNTAKINACANQSPDSVGIFVEGRHQSVTNFFGSTTISDRAVFVFEPLATAICGSDQHP